MLVLNREDVKQCLSMKEAIQVAADSLTRYTQGHTQVPLRTNLHVEKAGGDALFMPAYIGRSEQLGVKIVSVFPGNRALGKESISSTMLLLDAATGEILCLMDGEYLTQLRTGAVAGLATDLLARKDASVMVLFGTGGQAASQVEAVMSVRPIKQLMVLGRNLQKTEAFARRMAKKFPALRVTASGAVNACVEQADIITAVTTAEEPLFDGNRIKEGTHVNGVGSYTPDKRELDETLLQRASLIFCDTLDGVLGEAGDLLIPLNSGALKREDISGELGELLLLEEPLERHPEEITVFKTVGTAVLDVSTAYEVYRRALEKGLGQVLKLD